MDVRKEIKRIYNNKINYKNNVMNDRQKSQLKKAKDYAKSKKGECLSSNYTDNNSIMRWRCEKGHTWESRFCKVVNGGTWCPNCGAIIANKDRKISFESLKDIANNRGGKLLSNKKIYNNCNSKLLWECELGHQWSATAGSIKHTNTWCPYCNSSYRENLVRFIIESLTGLSFPKVRPKWLRNPITGRLLELDGYNEKNNIAFEYNGEQHYIKNKYFHKKKNFKDQIYRDNIKNELCNSRGVKVCNVFYNLKDSQLVNYIKNWLVNNNIKLSKNNIDLGSFKNYKYSRHEEFKKFVESIGYKLLDRYRTVNDHVNIGCDNGHIWNVQPRAVNNGNRCPFCSKRVKYSYNVIEKKSKELNIKLLENKYINNTIRMRFKCKICGAEFYRTATELMKNNGCECDKKTKHLNS